MPNPQPRADAYAVHRCACGHLCTWHIARCHAGDHTRPCDCDAIDAPCGGHDQETP